MAGITTEDHCFYLVANWTIDNFSCWNGDVHDPGMTTEGSYLSRKSDVEFELYPRGLSGRGEHLVVRVCKTKGPTSSGGLRGDLSFIGSDGSFLCTLEINGIMFRGNVLEFPPGPKFRDVLEHIKKNGTLHTDRLTLRFRFRHPEGKTEESGCIHHMNSMVDAFETYVKVNIKPSEENSEAAGYIMEYPLNDGRMESMCLAIDDSDDTILIVLGVGEFVGNKFTVRTLVTLLSSDDGSVLRTEENEHVVRDTDELVISNSLRKEELSQKGHLVQIDFKFIPSSTHKFISSHLSSSVPKFEVTPTKISRPLQTTFTQLNVSSTVLKEDLMCLFQDQDFSDFQLKCDNVSFPVHRNILSARSPVFKAMLSTDMTEAASNEVVIGDLDPSTLGLFLTYLYTGALEDLQCERALNLYYAADKYQVPSLKGECAKFLCSNVSLSNVCDVLSVILYVMF